MLVTIFNDAEADHISKLESAIKSLPGIETLKHQPHVYCGEVGDHIAEDFEKMNLVPTLFFC